MALPKILAQPKPDKLRALGIVALNGMFDDMDALGVLRYAASEVLPGDLAIVSSFGADSAVLSHVAAQARRSAATTHTHPEGVAGAVAVAVAAVVAWQSRATPLSRRDFLDAVLCETPPGETAAKIRLARDFAPGVSVRFAGAVLGTGKQISAPDTVPFALFCAAEFVHDYREALWQTVSGLGDRDTTCAIVGGIVALSVGAEDIPADWRKWRDPLSPV